MELKTIINVVPPNRRGAISPVEGSPFVLSPHIPDSVILLSEAIVSDSRPFFATRTFSWYHYCSQIWSGCGRPETRGQVRARPRTLSLPWHGIDYTI